MTCNSHSLLLQYYWNMTVLKGPQDAPLSLRRTWPNSSHWNAFLFFMHLLTSCLTDFHLHTCLGKSSLSAFFSLEVRCKMLIQYEFKCKCNLSDCKWTSRSNMNKTKNMNPLILIPLESLSERKANTGHVQVYSLYRSQPLHFRELNKCIPFCFQAIMGLVKTRLIHHERNRKEKNNLHISLVVTRSTTQPVKTFLWGPLERVL